MLSSTLFSPGINFLRRQASRIISFIVHEHVKRSSPLQLWGCMRCKHNVFRPLCANLDSKELAILTTTSSAEFLAEGEIVQQ